MNLLCKESASQRYAHAPTTGKLSTIKDHIARVIHDLFIECIMFVFLTYAQRAYRLQYNVICATTNFVGMLCMCGVKPRPLRMTAALAGALSASIASNC